jgi:hypothetical protein
MSTRGAAISPVKFRTAISEDNIKEEERTCGSSP